LATVLAVLACNLGLWTVLYESSVLFVNHPQIWLIPIAIAALVAEYFHRDRVAEPQRLAVRYLALSVIYVSSTADMYIAHLQDWRLALVLMLLCVAGVLLGIMLQVRSFLYLGVVFLVVDLASMLWYAAVDRGNTWVWYVSGIVLGAAIIALFAVFEKRRNDVLAAVQRLKAWQR
jgi:Na+/H+-translocating membrane pyrophosphatase